MTAVYLKGSKVKKNGVFLFGISVFRCRDFTFGEGGGKGALEQSTVRSPQSTVRSPQSTVRSPQSAVRSPQSVVHSP